jgi:hypothetical protein
MPERAVSFPRGELSLRTEFQSMRGFRTGDMTEIVWPRSLLKVNGGRAEGSGRCVSSFSGTPWGKTKLLSTVNYPSLPIQLYTILYYKDWSN